MAVVGHVDADRTRTGAEAGAELDLSIVERIQVPLVAHSGFAVQLLGRVEVDVAGVRGHRAVNRRLLFEHPTWAADVGGNDFDAAFADPTGGAGIRVSVGGIS